MNALAQAVSPHDARRRPRSGCASSASSSRSWPRSSSSRPRATNFLTVAQLAGHRHRRRDGRRRRGRRDDGRADAEHRSQRRLDRRPQRLPVGRHARRRTTGSPIVAHRADRDRRRPRLRPRQRAARRRRARSRRSSRRSPRSRSTAASSFEVTGGDATSPPSSSRTSFLEPRGREAARPPDAGVDRARRRARRRGDPALGALGRATSMRSARTPTPRGSPGSRSARRVITAFAISGALAGLGGFMFAARFANVDAVAGQRLRARRRHRGRDRRRQRLRRLGHDARRVLGALLVGDDRRTASRCCKISEFWKIFFNGDRDRRRGDDRRARHAASPGRAAQAPAGRGARASTQEGGGVSAAARSPGRLVGRWEALLVVADPRRSGSGARRCRRSSSTRPTCSTS